MRLYKYRSFENFEFALDIFVHGRLYAADFKSLNDPMEGRFVYDSGALTTSDLRYIRGEKGSYRILSLSETPSNMLMWSYYGGAHTGFVVGVRIEEGGVDIERMDYVESLKLDTVEGDLAKSILSRKFSIWRHEREVRVFQRENPFVSVFPEELILGVHACPRQSELLQQVAKKFYPDLEVRRIQRVDLETGGVDQDEV